MQQITRKVSCSYTMQNKQEPNPKTEPKHAVQGCPAPPPPPSFISFLCLLFASLRYVGVAQLTQKSH